MNKKFFLIVVFFIFLNFENNVFAHVSHYKTLKKLEFDLYRNNKLIGTHVYTFNRKENLLNVHSIINFEIKKLGVTLYKYFAEGNEEYIDGKFNSFSAKTKQNKKDKFCDIYLKEDVFFINGSSYKGKAPENFIIGTWWNHEIVEYEAQISAVSGRIIEQNVEFLGKEQLVINNKRYNALKFNFTSSDASLSKDKKLNTTVWYDEESLLWIKASFEKTGFWEYRLKNIF